MLFLLSRLKIKIKYYYFVYTKGEGIDKKEKEMEGRGGSAYWATANFHLPARKWNSNVWTLIGHRFVSHPIQEHSWTLEWAIRGNRRRPMTPPSENRGGNVQMKGWGRGKTIFFVFFWKKSLFFMWMLWEFHIFASEKSFLKR